MVSLVLADVYSVLGCLGACYGFTEQIMASQEFFLMGNRKRLLGAIECLGAGKQFLGARTFTVYKVTTPAPSLFLCER